MKKLLKKYIYVTLSMLVLATSMQTTFNYTTVKAQQDPNVASLNLNKTATQGTLNGQTGYRLELSAYATGNTSIIESTVPSDIVLVLDTSYSMNDGVDEVNTYPMIIAEDPDSYDGTGVMNNYKDIADYYYIYKDGKYVPIYKTDEFQYGTRKVILSEGVTVNKTIKVYSYKDESGIETYVPMQQDGTSYATIFSGTAEDIERFKNYEAVQFYHKDTAYTGARKIDVLKKSVKTFIENAAKDNVNHRIAIVSFNDYATLNSDFLDVQTNKDRLKTIVDGLTLGNATSSQLGMKVALDDVISDDVPPAGKRNNALILFTDGKPESSVVGMGAEETANATIAYSNEIKKKGYTVYSAGISNLLDNTINPKSFSPKSDVGMMNIYMQYVSSNYPNATSLTDSGNDGSYENGKFLYATDQASFEDMFESIRDEITTTESTLDEKTQLNDYVSEYFDFTSNSVEVYTQEYLGNNKWGSLVPFDAKVNVSDASVSVEGFSYKDNSVDKDRVGGKRLVATLFVTPKDGFIGGVRVNTNKEESGIYYNNNLVKEFEQPLVTVNLNYLSKNKSESVYLAKNLFDITDAIDMDTKKAGIQFYNNATSNKTYTLDGINNAFVDITYTIKNGSTIIGKCKVPAKGSEVIWEQSFDTTTLSDTTILSVTTEITSKDTATQSELSIRRDSNLSIYVFKPILSLKNDVAFAGDVYNLENVIQNVEWSNKETTSKPKGELPKLQYSFKKDSVLVDNANAYLIEETAAYKIQIHVNHKDITEHTSVGNASGKPSDGDFMIQAVKGELQISKTIDQAYTKNTSLNSNQSFVFKITVKDPVTNVVKETYYQTIDFDQQDVERGIYSKTLTLKGLKKGVYEVSEETNWSWKYILTGITTNHPSNEIYIGERLQGENYFGAETGTKINGIDIGNPGKVAIKNVLNQKSNVLGDCANAINQFVH